MSELSKKDVSLILDTYRAFAEVSVRPIKTVPTHRGETYCCIGIKWDPSFTIAAQRLSAEVINYGTDIDDLHPKSKTQQKANIVYN